VGEAGKRALLDYLGLEHHLGEEVPDAPADGRELEVGVFAGGKDAADDESEAPPEECDGCDDEDRNEDFFGGRKMLRLCQRGGQRNHKRTPPKIHDRSGFRRGQENGPAEVHSPQAHCFDTGRTAKPVERQRLRRRGALGRPPAVHPPNSSRTG